MEDNIIKVTLNEWNLNAGIYGLYSILKWSGKDILEFSKKYTGKNQNLDSKFSLYFPREYLDNFVENFYGYLIDKYFDQISYGKIINFKNEAIELANIEDNKVEKKELDNLNNYIKNVLKRYFKSNSYKAALELIEGSDNIKERILSLKDITLKKKEEVIDKTDEIKKISREIVEILNELEKDEYRKYIGGKNVIYTIIKNNWDGVSILNKQVKEKNVYTELDNFFVAPMNNYIDSDKKKYRYNCCSCDRPIKNLDNSISFLTNTGFDTARKSSYVYNFQNDQGLCDICKFIYMCVPAGFSYIVSKGMGLFVNSNSSIESLINANDSLNYKVNENDDNPGNSIYKKIVTSIIKQQKASIDYSLSDVQVVFFEDNRYRFTLLSENLLNIIKDSEKEFDNLKLSTIRENNISTLLYEEAVKRILNNQNLYLFINKLLHYSISRKEGVFYNTFHVNNLLLINLEYLKGAGLMTDVTKENIESMRKVGRFVRESYKKKNSEKKLDGITYKLLNSLKTSNPNNFLDVLIRCFMYIGEEIPKSVVAHLENKDKFKTLGYAFVIGLNGISKKENEIEGKNESSDISETN